MNKDKKDTRREWETAYWRKILKSEELLEIFITSYERHNIVMRAAALERLAAGKSYRQISKELRLSPQTISGIKKAISKKKYRSYLERSKKERRKKKYSVSAIPRKVRLNGTPRRTKYGTVYLPY